MDAASLLEWSSHMPRTTSKLEWGVFFFFSISIRLLVLLTDSLKPLWNWSYLSKCRMGGGAMHLTIPNFFSTSSPSLALARSERCRWHRVAIVYCVVFPRNYERDIFLCLSLRKARTVDGMVHYNCSRFLVVAHLLNEKDEVQFAVQVSIAIHCVLF